MDDLREVYGDELLKYVLVLDQLDDHPEAGFPEAQSMAMDFLRTVASQTDGQHPLQRCAGISNVLTAHLIDVKTSVANNMRVSCGGELPDIVAGDDNVEHLLLQFALDAYPAFLLPDLDQSPSSSRLSFATSGTFRHPSHDDFCRAVLKDQWLQLLFSDSAKAGADSATSDELFETGSRYLYFSSGHAYALQLPMIASLILGSAFSRVDCFGELGVASYLQMVRQVLREVRDLARGRVVSTPLVLGLANVEIDSSLQISLPWGVLRARRGGDDRFLGSDVDAKLILETTVQTKIIKKVELQKGEQPDSGLWEQLAPSHETWRKDSDWKVYLTRFALLLASPVRPYLAAEEAARTILESISFAPRASWRASAPVMPAPSTVLTGDMAVSVEAWAARLKNFPSSLKTAVRRTVMAAASRIDPVDGFVDAMLAWENMFSGSPETSLRVCGSIALLLEPNDFTARLKFFSRLQDLYGKRSVILHGREEPGFREAAVLRDEAVDISLNCMRKLFTQEGILRLDDAAQRGKYVLLGAFDVNDIQVANDPVA